MSDFTGIPLVDELLDAAEEVENRRRNQVRQVFLPRDRYYFDCVLDPKRWRQLDSEEDGSHVGVWVNKGELRVLRYTEGDVELVQCPEAGGFDQEIAHQCAYYRAAPIYITVHEAVVIFCYQDRRSLFIDPSRLQGTPDRGVPLGPPQGPISGGVSGPARRPHRSMPQRAFHALPDWLDGLLLILRPGIRQARE